MIKPPPAYSDEDEMSSREPAKKALKPINGQPGGDGDVEIDTIRAQQLKVERELQAYSGRSFIVPSCSAWFHFDQIHEIEMQNLPEFFCAKFPHKNPVTYLNFRNAIIRMYREKPDTYLTASGKYSLKFYYIDCLLSRAWIRMINCIFVPQKVENACQVMSALLLDSTRFLSSGDWSIFMLMRT